MSEVSLARRNFLKTGAAAAAAIMASAAASAGIPAASVKKFDEEYDVVVVGSGFAGMACALKASRAGLKVLMIEKMSVVGGNSAICGGNVACPVNPVQKAQNIQDSKELFIKDCLKDGLGINYTNLLGVIADRCNDTIKFVEECGAEFVPNKMLFEAGHSVPRSYEIKAGSGSGYSIFRRVNSAERRPEHSCRPPRLARSRLRGKRAFMRSAVDPCGEPRNNDGSSCRQILRKRFCSCPALRRCVARAHDRNARLPLENG